MGLSEAARVGARDQTRWMTLALRAWLPIALLAVGILIASVPGYVLPLGADLPAGFTTEDVGSLTLFGLAVGRLTSIGTAVLSIALASLLYLRRREDRMALLVSYFLLIYSVTFAGPGERLEFSLTGSSEITLAATTLLLTLPTVLILSLFPNGRFVPRWTRWLIIGALLWLPVYFVLSPQNPTSDTIQATYVVGLVWILMIIVPMLYAQIYRYRRVSTPAERQQTKWVLYGFGLWLTLIFLSSVPYLRLLSQPEGTPAPASLVGLGFVWWITQAILPVSLAIALLRYRLWEIDLLINRTLVYGILTVFLALVYLAAVVVLQQLFRRLTGQSSPLAVVLSTLIIAALFNPLRMRVQTFINRRFYRGRYDAAQTLVELSDRLRDEMDLGDMSESLLSMVDRTLQPRYLSLWMREVKREG